MGIKKYNGYISEKSDEEYDDEYYSKYGSDEDENEEQDVEYLLYLIRDYVKKYNVKEVITKKSSSGIKVEMVLNKVVKINDLINLFSGLKKMSNDLMSDYDCEFDLWETKNKQPLIILDYYLMDDDEVF